MYDIIIIGAGPAGLTAAIYAKRASKNVLVLEAKSYGGQVGNTREIDNYPGEAKIDGFELASKMYEQAINLGAKILFEKAVEIKDNKDTKEVITRSHSYQGETIIIATGSDNRKLKLEGEDRLLGKGLSYCAYCDGAFYKDKLVAVIGSNESAIEDALYLSDIAKKVYLINPKDSFKEGKSLDKDNIEVLYNHNITKLNYNDKLESIDVKDNKGEQKTIPVDGLFVAIGRTPENENFRSLVNMDNSGYIIAGEDCHTNVPGIFVAGDNRTKRLRQIVTATSDGAIAATEAIKYINKRRSDNNV